MRTFLSCEFKTQFETCQDQKSRDEEKKSRRKKWNISKKLERNEYEKNLSHFYAFTNWKHSSSGRQVTVAENSVKSLILNSLESKFF